MNRQAISRVDGERRAQLSLLRLLCAVSIWRTAMTRVLPLCGASAWWVTLVCLLPGFAAAALLRGVMALTRMDTLMEAVRACLGRGGAVLMSAVLTVLLVAEGVSSTTALITLFTEGVGTRGTQFTLAILTGGVLLFSLHREGLARAALFFRWLMGGAAVVLAVFLFLEAKPDHIFPLYGEGDAAVMAAIKAGFGLAWPVVLLLTVESNRQGRLRSAILPAFSAVGAVFLLACAVPQELLSHPHGLAELLLLPTRYASNALRVAALSLLMLAFFLGIGGSAQLAVQQLCMPMKSAPAWLPYVLLAALFLTQAANVPMLWTALGRIEPWLLVPLALLGVICLPIAFLRRETT